MPVVFDPAWEYWMPADLEVAWLLDTAAARGPVAARLPWRKESHAGPANHGLSVVRDPNRVFTRLAPAKPEGVKPKRVTPERPARVQPRARCSACLRGFRLSRPGQTYCSTTCRDAGPARASCPGCGDLFWPRSAGQRFCCRGCEDAPKCRPCRRCGESFFRVRNEQVYCSTRCSLERVAESRRLPRAVCRGCGWWFAPARATRVYCSQRCSLAATAAARRVRPAETRCRGCGLEFVPDRQSRTHCSRRCAAKG